MKDRDDRRLNAYLILNIVWGITTAILLLLMLYITWQKEQLEIHHRLSITADKIRSQLDDFIVDINESIYELPLQHSEDLTCTPELSSALQHQVFNNPQLSGFIIKNRQNRVLCSTVKQESKPIKEKRSLALYGPVQYEAQDKPAYILQKKIGPYVIDVYILKEVIAKVIQNDADIVQTIALYDVKKNKNLLQIERNATWHDSLESQYLNPDKIKRPLLHSTLAQLEDVQIILEANPQEVSRLTWLRSIIAILIIMVFSLFVYFILRHLIGRHFSIHRALQNAIKNESFYPVYQPILNPHLDICSGAEILLRWRVNDNEIIMPNYFIADAEQSGLIVPITLQLIELSFKECQSILQQHKAFYLSFNISVSHFEDSHFFDSFFNLCDQYHIPAQQIMFEITERELLSQHDLTLAKRMHELREKGFSLAVDDFGTGHASISYLRHFPFNFLKIDKLFIRAIGTGAVTETLNLSIIHMAKNLNLKIIAEGVETFPQLEYLQEHDVDYMQGWYFASAMEVDELEHFIKRSSL